MSPYGDPRRREIIAAPTTDLTMSLGSDDGGSGSSRRYFFVVCSAAAVGLIQLVAAGMLYAVLLCKNLLEKIPAFEHNVSAVFSGQYNIIVTYASYAAILCLLFRFKKGMIPKFSVDVRTWRSASMLVVAAGVIAIIFYSAVLHVFSIGYTITVPKLSINSVVRGVLFAILVPVVDEIVFRDWLFGRLRSLGIGDGVVIATTSVVWAMLGAFTLLAFIQVTINAMFGIVQGCARSSTNIVVPIFMHSGFNVITLLMIDQKL
jgi:membrane protease YdiL (CAAX protease family)